MGYKIRDRRGHVRGPYSEKEVIARILRGRYNGQEEISPEPFEKWQKLASVTAFYDIFLKRLFDKKYKTPTVQSDPSGTQQGERPAEALTQQDQKSRTKQQVDKHTLGTKKLDSKVDYVKTKQIVHDQGAAPGFLVDPDVIKDLFSKSKEMPEEAAQEEGAGEQPDTKLEVELEESGKLLGEPLDEEAPQATLGLTFDAFNEEEAKKRSDQKRRERNRKLILGTVLVGLLFLLFYQGEAPEKVSDTTEDALAEKDVSPILASTVNKEERARILIAEGTQLYERDSALSYYRAIDLFRHAVLSDDRNSEALGRLVETTARFYPHSSDSKKFLNEILGMIDRGRVTDPHSSYYYRAEALLALHHKKLEESKQQILNAVETDPHSVANALLLGEVSYAIGDFKSAEAALLEAVKGDPFNVRAYYLLARIAKDQRRFALADRLVQQVLQINPIHPRAYLLLGDLARRKNRLRKALAYYDQGSRFARFASRTVARDLFLQLGNLQRLSGRKQASQRSFLLAYYYALDRSGKISTNVKGLDTSDVRLQKLVGEVVYGKRYFQDKADNSFRQKYYDQAASYYIAATLIDPNDAQLLFQLGETLEKTALYFEDFKRVMAIYERALEKDSRLVHAYINLGLLETEQYNLDRAYALISQAVALSPQSAAPYVALGKHFYVRQDYRKSRDQFIEAQKIKPGESETLYYAGLLLLEGKASAVQDAMEFFYNSLLADPLNYDALIEWVKLKVTNYEKNYAIKFIRTLREKYPKNPNLFWALGETYAANKEFNRSIEYYHRALDLDNRFSKVRMALGRSLESIGELDKAVAEYRLAAQLDRRNSKGFFRAAELLYQQKKYSKAEETLKFLVDVTPRYPGVHRYLSKIYRVANKQDLAVKEMEQEVANNPLNATFRIELAQLLMEYKKYEKAAKGLAEVTNLPSLTKAPENVYDKVRAYLLLSRCYRALSRSDSAEGAIRLALQIDPDDAELHKELGYVYVSLQRDRDAVQAFKVFLSRKPAEKDAEQVRRWIKKLEIPE